jgi:pantoate--beta-alanine ligase
MRVCKTIPEVRAVRAELGYLGFVPTMGFLHEGHLSLVRKARAECEAVAVSIFVNPTQFGPNEDFTRYPRDMERDLALLDGEGVDFVFTPEPSEIYPPGAATRIEVGTIAEVLEGAVRPGHFSGVATVVTKLFNIVAPNLAYFGQKDAQQCAVIRQVVRDLDLPVALRIEPTVREPDGLAMSSRNVYLDAAQREEALVVYRALRSAAAVFEAGETDAGLLRTVMRDVLAGYTFDYVSVADPDTMAEVETAAPGGVLSTAVRFGATRLIDNLILGAG